MEEIHRAQKSNALPIEQLKTARVPSRLRSLLAFEPAARPGIHYLAAQLRLYQQVAKHSGTEKSIAVLPFMNMSADPENEYLSDGLTEDLIMAFSRLKGLRVPARTSSFAFKGKNEDIRWIGEQLNVKTIWKAVYEKLVTDCG
jgi:hypothetical protein